MKHPKKTLTGEQFADRLMRLIQQVPGPDAIVILAAAISGVAMGAADPEGTVAFIQTLTARYLEQFRIREAAEAKTAADAATVH